VSTWLQRIADRLAKGPDPEGSAHITEHFYKRGLYPKSSEFLESLLQLFPEGEALRDSDLRVLVNELRGLWGPEKALEEGDLSLHVDFWCKLSDRTSSPYAMACHADTLLLAGRVHDAVTIFLDVLEVEPELLDELGEEIAEHARDIGGDVWLQFRLASLRVSISGLADQDSDAVRELYSEILEEFSGDTAAVQEIRRIGEAMAEAVERGEMPRAMVIRGPSRTSN
jgi:hypothetical protein